VFCHKVAEDSEPDMIRWVGKSEPRNHQWEECDVHTGYKRVLAL